MSHVIELIIGYHGCIILATQKTKTNSRMIFN